MNTLENELNNIKIKNLITVLKKETLPESFWLLVDNAKTNCEKLLLNGITDSSGIFNVFKNEENLDKIITKTGLNMQYIKTVYNLLKFHSYKPFSLHRIQSIKKEHIAALKYAQVNHNGELLKRCSTKDKRMALLKQTKIPKEELDNIIRLSDLIRKPGIKETKALLFMKLGIESLYHLGQKKASIFREELKTLVEHEKLNRAIPTEKEINSDISWAKIYPRIIRG
jgi:hypothetical protein